MKNHRVDRENTADTNLARRKRARVVAAIVAVLGATALLLPAVSTPFAGEESVTVLRAGDVVRMKDTSVTCRVSRSDPPVLECLRLRALAGTYGVRMSARKVTVYRVKSATIGETVFSATHNVRRFTTCRSGR